MGKEQIKNEVMNTTNMHNFQLTHIDVKRGL